MAESDLKKLQEQLSAVRVGINESLARQAALERKNLWLTWGIVIVVLGYMFLGYTTFKKNFAPDKIQESLVAHGPEMITSVGQAMSEAAAEVVPVYYTEVQTKSVEVLPQATEALEKELTALSEETVQSVEKQLGDALSNVEATQKAALRKTFPDLKDEEIEKLLNDTMKDAEDELEGLTGYILSKTVGDIIDLDKTIKAFDTSNLPSQEHELSRQLVHNFLLMLDDELMEMKLEKPVDSAADAKKGAK